MRKRPLGEALEDEKLASPSNRRDDPADGDCSGRGNAGGTRRGLGRHTCGRGPKAAATVVLLIPLKSNKLDGATRGALTTRNIARQVVMDMHQRISCRRETGFLWFSSAPLLEYMLRTDDVACGGGALYGAWGAAEPLHLNRCRLAALFAAP
jgi:hypothetical protein